MAEIIDILSDSRSLTQRINKIKPPAPFLMEKIFGTNEVHDSETVDIEIVSGSDTLAQFANPNEIQPRPVKKISSKVLTVKIPRTYESKTFTVQEMRDLQILGNIYANAADKSAAQKEKINLELSELKNRAIRLREKMAADAVSTGLISVSQNNIAFEVDYLFENNKQLLTLAGADKWDASTPKIMSQLRTWKRNIAQRSGINADTLVLGTSASELFLGNDQILKMLDNNQVRVGSLDLNQKNAIGATYIGTIMGLDIYEYTQQYVNEAGSATDMIASTSAIMIASGAPFKTHSGAIYRLGSGNIASPVSYDMYLEAIPNPNRTSIQWDCEQKSLPTIHDPGAVISVKVA
jgi:hypothetical protein